MTKALALIPTDNLLTTVSPPVLLNGSSLTASGSRFKGISEASGGNVQNVRC
jgi:hypothetical protein